MRLSIFEVTKARLDSVAERAKRLDLTQIGSDFDELACDLRTDAGKYAAGAEELCGPHDLHKVVRRS